MSDRTARCDGVVPLEAELLVDPVDTGAASPYLGDRAPAWLGPREIDPGGGCRRRHAVDLLAPLTEVTGGVAVRTSAFVDLGAPVPEPGGWRVPISWRAAGLSPLFPVFSGTLHVAARRVWIEGVYAPAGGPIGPAVDRAVLHLAARATAQRLLADLAAALPAA